MGFPLPRLSLCLIMDNILCTVADDRIKGAYCYFALESDSSFTGYKFGSGVRIPYLENYECHSCIQFMQCKNYKKLSHGYVCAMMTSKFEHFPLDLYFPCEFVLFQGVFYD